ncbi:hypothetical protein [Mycolicibacterium fortuitum]|uniref:hypothetical protein n=1 Tax=Mycolicibacterium fortuitum TaxID=1766 RepID=UPI00261CBC84|nr:hypothetical protein [Mycolicibacterium fortuitum]
MPSSARTSNSISVTVCFADGHEAVLAIPLHKPLSGHVHVIASVGELFVTDCAQPQGQPLEFGIPNSGLQQCGAGSLVLTLGFRQDDVEIERRIDTLPARSGESARRFVGERMRRQSEAGRMPILHEGLGVNPGESGEVGWNNHYPRRVNHVDCPFVRQNSRAGGPTV